MKWAIDCSMDEVQAQDKPLSHIPSGEIFEGELVCTDTRIGSGFGLFLRIGLGAVRIDAGMRTEVSTDRPPMFVRGYRKVGRLQATALT